MNAENPNLQETKNLVQIALQKLQSFITPEKEALSPKAQEQLQEIEIALLAAQKNLTGKHTAPPAAAKEFLKTIYHQLGETNPSLTEEIEALPDNEVLHRARQHPQFQAAWRVMSLFPQGTYRPSQNHNEIEINNLPKGSKPEGGELLLQKEKPNNTERREWFLVRQEGTLISLRVSTADPQSGYEEFVVAEVYEDTPAQENCLREKIHRLCTNP